MQPTHNSKWRNIAFSLAGMVQAIELVDKLAKTGYSNSVEQEICIKTLWVRNPDSVEAVFGSTANMLAGLETLQTLLDNRTLPQRNDILRYCMGVLHLHKQLSRQPAMLNIIGERLDKSLTQLEMFGPTHENTLANLAEIYTDTISTFRFRIQVTGEHQHLQQPRVANLVRVLLLCAIRAAILWHQVGGRRWHLLIYRKNISAALSQLIKEAKQNLLQ